MSQTLMLDMLSLLVSASVKGSIILVLALVALRLMRRTSAAARHAVLAAALATFLLLPAVQAVAPSWTLAVLPAAPAEISALSQRMTPSLAPRGEPFTAPLESSGDQVLRSTAHPDVASHDAASQPFGVVLDWRQVIVALWLLGAACIVLRLLAGVAGVWLLERRATMVTDGVWLHTAHALAQRLGLARGVTLLSGDRGSVPLTWGVLQPVVWLPSGAAEWDVERRTVVLAHELAHVKRRDAITQWAANLSIALHWFNPLVWVVVRRLRVERERACDDAVLTLGTQPAVYAEHLLDIVRAIGGRGDGDGTSHTVRGSSAGHPRWRGAAHGSRCDAHGGDRCCRHSARASTGRHDAGAPRGVARTRRHSGTILRAGRLSLCCRQRRRASAR